VGGAERGQQAEERRRLMPLPAGIPKIPCTLGVGFGIEGGEALGATIKVTASVRGLVWAATGDAGVADALVLTVAPGASASFSLIPTDLAGWLLNGAAVDVSGGKQSHTYTVSVQWTKPPASGAVPVKVGTPFVIKNLVVPQSTVGTLDLDKAISTSDANGVPITLPPTFGGAVTSVNGKTGVVTLSAADVSAVPTSRQIAGLDLTADRTAAALKTALAITESDVASLTTDLAARQLVLVPTATKTTAYTAAVNDLVMTDATSAAFAVTLPSAPADKSIIEVKKIDSSTNAVTITCGGTDTFAVGGTTLALAFQGHAARMQYQATGGKWITLDNDVPLTQLDARYVGKSVVTAKGDIIAATASGAVTNVAVGTNGQVLTADSTQASGVKWAAAAGGTIVGIASPPKTAMTNKYTRVPFRPIELGQTTSSIADSLMWLQPIPVVENCTLAEMHARTDSTAGTAGSVVRMGVYPMAAGASPLFDSGALATTSANTTVISTANLALTPAWYLIAIVWQGNPTTKPTTRLGNAGLTAAYESEQYFLSDGAPAGYTMSSVSGALPALGTLTPQYVSGTTCPIVGLKFT
jgi:Cu/Ag efflux protein CusF